MTDEQKYSRPREADWSNAMTQPDAPNTPPQRWRIATNDPQIGWRWIGKWFRGDPEDYRSQEAARIRASEILWDCRIIPGPPFSLPVAEPQGVGEEAARLIVKAIDDAINEEIDDSAEAPSPPPAGVDIDELEQRLGSLTDASDIGADHGFNFTIGELRAILSELRELRERLPDGMKCCTIVFKECERGHGWLTATNWVQHGCPTCELTASLDREKRLEENCRVTHDAYEKATEGLHEQGKTIERLRKSLERMVFLHGPRNPEEMHAEREAKAALAGKD